MFKKFQNKQEFFQDRLSMSIGSLANLYSNSSNPPSPDKIFEEAVKMTDKVWSWGQRFDEFPELDTKLKERFEEENKRVIGRYHASEIWGIMNGKIPPSKFLEPRTFTEDEMKRMYWGTIVHEGIQQLFGFQENKYEIKVDKDITIVCKIDLEIGKKIFEFKTRESIEDFETLPSWYDLQAQCYLEVKDMDELYLYLIGWGLTRRLFIVKRERAVFDNICVNLKDYHQKVLKAYVNK